MAPEVVLLLLLGEDVLCGELVGVETEEDSVRGRFFKGSLWLLVRLFCVVELLIHMKDSSLLVECCGPFALALVVEVCFCGSLLDSSSSSDVSFAEEVGEKPFAGGEFPSHTEFNTLSCALLSEVAEVGSRKP